MNRPAVKVIKAVLVTIGVAIVSMGGMVHASSTVIPPKQATPRRHERRIVEPNRKAADAVEALLARL